LFTQCSFYMLLAVTGVVQRRLNYQKSVLYLLKDRKTFKIYTNQAASGSLLYIYVSLSIHDHSDYSCIFSDEQHGFFGGRSTVTSLVEFSNFILGEMENGLQVDAVYKDFSKAFDWVNHELLLGRLTWKSHFPLIFWMGSYLISRLVHNTFVLAFICLRRFTVVLGCLRVAIYLGPLFFIAEINDVLDIFENVWYLAC
jgi:hypothetical protein